MKWWDHLTQIEGGLHFEFQHPEGVNCIVTGPMYATKNYPSSSVPRFGDRWIFKLKETDVGVTRVLSWWVIPVCGEDWIAELADFRILLAISHQRSTAIEPQTRGGSHHERTWHVRLRHWRRPSQEEFDDMCKYSDEWPLGSVGWESGGAPSCHWPSRQQLPHVHPTNYSIQFWWWTVSWKLS